MKQHPEDISQKLSLTPPLSARLQITSPTAVAPQSAQSAARVRVRQRRHSNRWVGFGGRGGSHINAFKKMNGVRLGRAVRCGQQHPGSARQEVA